MRAIGSIGMVLLTYKDIRVQTEAEYVASFSRKFDNLQHKAFQEEKPGPFSRFYQLSLQPILLSFFFCNRSLYSVAVFLDTKTGSQQEQS